MRSRGPQGRDGCSGRRGRHTFNNHTCVSRPTPIYVKLSTNDCGRERVISYLILIAAVFFSAQTAGGQVLDGSDRIANRRSGGQNGVAGEPHAARVQK